MAADPLDKNIDLRGVGRYLHFSGFQLVRAQVVGVRRRWILVAAAILQHSTRYLTIHRARARMVGSTRRIKPHLRLLEAQLERISGALQLLRRRILLSLKYCHFDLT
jgi:uncharacterized membrane protein YedE/YeeE